MTAVKLGQTYSYFSDADRTAVHSAADGTTFVDENKNVWRRNSDAEDGSGFELTVGNNDNSPLLLKAIAIPGVGPVAGEAA